MQKNLLNMSSEIAKYSIGQTVYHVADDDPGVVIAIIFHDDHVTYRISWLGRLIDEHSAVELSKERTYLGFGPTDDDGKNILPFPVPRK